ncbi:HAD family hydrolase [Blastopirellula marina]|uniref:Hydrolase-putative phosphatase or haloacid dehydrogenase-like protein n=1 Tax=Blastopirellula marina DSM 3645 TaxID=314230 RepID=A3ZTL7_9BACT|nr:HAD family phosphatase [Blastopirellula marina]EAQ80283.1 hydrolase-putative phosphatase or haloacid dehydrogenase-like protein [Blastopirellula marina DSM 3645]
MSSQPIEFFYFDLGNVLLYFDHDRACRQMAQVADAPVEQVRDVVFFSGMQVRYETGEINTAEFHAYFCQQTGRSPSEDKLAWAASDIFELNHPVIEIAQSLHGQGRRLGILSNTCACHWDFCSAGRYAFLHECFQHYVLSYEAKSMKPDPGIYRAAIDQAGVASESIFFVDDRPENVAGALECGLDAVLFIGADRLREDLAARGIQVG